MRLTWFWLFLIVPLLVSACAGTAPQPNLPEDPSATNAAESPTASGDPQAVDAPPIDPLAIDVILDDSAAVEQLIPLEGGVMKLETPDGAKYTLEIPAGALLEPVQVRMTPVEQITGLPFGEQSYAVHLEPEGLVFYQLARLTIEIPVDFALEEQIFFGYRQAGDDVFLAPPEASSGAMTIQISHFSGYGVTKGLLADIEPVRAQLGGSDETRLQSQIAEAIIRERQQGGDEGDPQLAAEFERLSQEYYERVVKPRIAAARQSCAAGRLAIDTAITFEHQLAITGMEGRFAEIDLDELLNTGSRVCLEEEYQLCVEQHVVHRMIPIWLALERQGQLLGTSTPEEPSEIAVEARRLTEQCLTFELEFESSGRTMDMFLGFEGSVSARVPLRFDAQKIEITGTGPLISETAEFFAEGCTVDYTPADGTFEVLSLTFETDLETAGLPGAPAGQPGQPEQLGKVTSLNLEYFPGQTGGPLTVTCDGEVISEGVGSTWFATFMLSHLDDQSENASRLAYIADEWTVHGDELFGERSWQRSDPSTDTSEQGTMRLYHRPGEQVP